MSIGYEVGVIAELDGMAKARKPTPKAEPEPEQDAEARISVITLKGDKEWAKWFKDYADFLSLPQTTVLDVALREQAKRDGFSRPMPKRLKK